MKLNLIVAASALMLASCGNAQNKTEIENFDSQAAELVGKTIQIDGYLSRISPDGKTAMLTKEAMPTRPPKDSPECKEKPSKCCGKPCCVRLNGTFTQSKENTRVTVEGVVTEHKITLEDVENMEKKFEADKANRPEPPADAQADTSKKCPERQGYNRIEMMKKQINDSGKGYIIEYSLDSVIIK